MMVFKIKLFLEYTSCLILFKVNHKIFLIKIIIILNYLIYLDLSRT